jgi:ubiquinone/menaquinone biosynthesis C-methylase UbiE
MRYDWGQPIPFEVFSTSFFEEIDRRLFKSVGDFMSWKRVPFDNLIDFDQLRYRNVLEIGVGMGSLAQLLSVHSGSYTGIDITNFAVKATSERLKAFGLSGRICQMDAEKMSFADATFDYIWSWGVIHHSSNTQYIIREMHRVLKPGGTAMIMVYNRGWWNYYIVGGLGFGIARGGFFKTGSLTKSIQRNTDGALARYYSKRGWKTLVQEYFHVKYTEIKGQKSDLFLLPGSKLKKIVMDAVPNTVTRFLTNHCGMGGFLVSELIRK